MFAWYHATSQTLDSYTMININEKRRGQVIKVYIKPDTNFRKQNDRPLQGTIDLLNTLASRINIWHNAFIGTAFAIASPNPKFGK